MKGKTIATRAGDKLVYTHDSRETGVLRRMGYIVMKDGAKIPVGVDSVLARGYWEPVEEKEES
ncbi:hypothetical protein [Actinomycetia phage DSL-LC01]|nr:hypothetical protein [Actinomycetia phage DSL-LC01]